MQNDPRDPRDWPERGNDEAEPDEPWREPESGERPAAEGAEAGWPSEDLAAARQDYTAAEAETTPDPSQTADVAEARDWEAPPGEAWEAAPPSRESWESTPPSTAPVEPAPADAETWDATRREEPAAVPAGEPPWPSEPAADVDRQPPSEVESFDEVAPEREPAHTEQASQATEANTVPATEVGESTRCPRCGTENRPGLAFCRNCGQRLVAAGVAPTVERPGAPEGTQQCPRCGTHNRAGTAFCQNCGANLRGMGEPGYVPPAVAGPPPVAGERERTHAILGPIVLLIGMVGIVTAWLLPFEYGTGSLYERSFGTADGYGLQFWNGYPEVTGTLADQAYFGFAAPSPILAVLLLVLAIAGFVRATPGVLQRVGLVIALLWSVGLAVLFVVVEVAGTWEGNLVPFLAALSPGGIIFFLASLIVMIGTLTRFGRA